MTIEEAFKQALILAITAPTAEQCRLATDLAEQIAGSLDEVTVQRIKREIEQDIDG